MKQTFTQMILIQTPLVIQEDVDLKYLQNILPSVLKELASVGKDHILTKFMVLVCAKKFPLTNIAFSLFCDVVSWYSLSDTRCMRYSEDTMQFFWVGLKLLKGLSADDNVM